ncbi:MAG: hypothetical protein EOO05_10315 [Chitinophagaceae bacterium]|nr:MAG: hypothetical protein EOO05_10315 [Chitinophagaceae bacterium]
MKSFFACIALSLILVLSSCNSQTAAKYNNAIVGYETELLPQVQLTESNIAGYAESGKWDSVQSASKRMESSIGDAISKIDKLKVPDVTGAGDFKQASIRYFSYMKSIYAGYSSVASKSTDEERGAEWQRLATVLKEKDNVVSSYQAAQLKFTKANNVRIENAK